ncbi:MAG: sulfotransferase [Microcoleaceae cyanobacterium]
MSISLSRQIKDRILRNYYSFRIKSTAEPNRLAFRHSPYKVLLILSHMRSGSSLLTHLLVDNPEIAGYGETHLCYSSEADFKELLLKVYWSIRGLRMDHTYVMDKILHNQRLPEIKILQSEFVKVIFLVRQPTTTIASLLKLKSHWSWQNAIRYYSGRLEALEMYAQSINDPQRSFFLTYNNLINQTEDTLQALQNFLGLQMPLSENYQLTPKTGMKGIGDSSENIKAGKILRRPQSSNFVLSEESSQVGTIVFERCCNILSQCCQKID